MITLREIDHHDFKDIHNFASKEEVCRYQAWGPNSEEDTRNFIEGALKEQHSTPRRNFNFAISLSSDDKVVGTCGIYLKGNDIAEIGFTLTPEFWGKGVGSSVAQMLIDKCLIDFKVRMIVATCDILNLGSNALLKKVGFSKVEIIKNHMNIRGRFRDTAVYELLLS